MIRRLINTYWDLYYNSPLICLSLLFANFRSQFFTRSSREIYQTVRIDCHSFLSRVRVSVQPNVGNWSLMDATLKSYYTDCRPK